MNNRTRRGAALLLALTLMTTLLTPAFAAKPEERTAHATYWQGNVVVEGLATYLLVDKELMYPINLDGNVYVPLVVGAEWSKATTSLQWGSDNINFLYDYFQPRVPYSSSDVPNNTPEELADYKAGCTEGFDVTVLPTLTTSIRGVPFQTTNAQGEPLYPISHKGVTYIPIRTVAQVGGFGFWLHVDPSLSSRTIYLFRPLTQAQLEAGRAYADRIEAYAKDLAQDMQGLKTSYNLEYEQMIAKLVDIRTRLSRVRDLSIPSAPTLTQAVLSFNSTFDFRMAEILDARIDLVDPIPGTVGSWRTLVPESLGVGVLNTMNYHTNFIRSLCDGMAAGMA